MLYKVMIPETKFIYYWMSKEYGSWEDHNHDINHPCAILQNSGKTLELTTRQINDIIISGEYQSTGWNDDEIEGGKRTKESIARFVKKLKLIIN